MSEQQVVGEALQPYHLSPAEVEAIAALSQGAAAERDAAEEVDRHRYAESIAGVTPDGTFVSVETGSDRSEPDFFIVRTGHVASIAAGGEVLVSKVPYNTGSGIGGFTYGTKPTSVVRTGQVHVVLPPQSKQAGGSAAWLKYSGTSTSQEIPIHPIGEDGQPASAVVMPTGEELKRIPLEVAAGISEEQKEKLRTPLGKVSTIRRLGILTSGRQGKEVSPDQVVAALATVELRIGQATAELRANAAPDRVLPPRRIRPNLRSYLEHEYPVDEKARSVLIIAESVDPTTIFEPDMDALSGVSVSVHSQYEPAPTLRDAYGKADGLLFMADGTVLTQYRDSGSYDYKAEKWKNLSELSPHDAMSVINQVSAGIEAHVANP